jgi:hypothetical protein
VENCLIGLVIILSLLALMFLTAVIQVEIDLYKKRKKK